MIRAALLSPFREEDLGRFADVEGYEFTYAGDGTDGLRETEVFVGQPTADQFAAAPGLRWVQICSSGADNYLRPDSGLPQDAVLTTVSGAFGQSISEYVLAMVLAFYKNMHLYRDNQNAGIWHDEGVSYSPEGRELLILGAGDIGTHVARLFSVFGCRVTGCRRNASVPAPGFHRMIPLDRLDEELPKADIVVCCLPHTPATAGLLDRRRLSLLKEGSVLVNVGRGTLIDLQALDEILREGRILGAAIDVTDPEPLPAEHPLWHNGRCILTPHATGKTFGHLKATEENMFRIQKENLARYRDGRELQNVLDRENGYRLPGNRA